MTKITIKTLLLALLTLAASTAFSQDQDRQGQNGQWHSDRDYHGCTRACVKAPEIDPAQALSALALLGGTVAIIRGYRRGKR